MKRGLLARPIAAMGELTAHGCHLLLKLHELGLLGLPRPQDCFRCFDLYQKMVDNLTGRSGLWNSPRIQ